MKLCTPEQIDWSCLPDGDLEDLDPDRKALAEQLGWSAFSVLTAYQVSACPIELRPCRTLWRGSTWYEAPVVGGDSVFQPFTYRGEWFNAVCGSCEGTCMCEAGTTLRLPPQTGGIAKVTIDGDVIPPTSYRIDNGALLVRTDGELWPFGQNLSLDPDQDGTFAIWYYEGAMPTALDLYATGRLSYEFYKDLCGDACDLPLGVRAVSRQGVDFELTMDMFGRGTTGIPAVDAVIAMRNPNRLKMPSRVINPQAGRSRVTTRRFS